MRRMEKNIEKKFNKLKVKGDINEISEFCDEVEEVVINENSKEGKDFEKWKPNKEDDYDSVKEKTAKSNSLNDNNLSNNVIDSFFKVIGKIEKKIYDKIMLKTNKCYYSNNKISCVLKKGNNKLERVIKNFVNKLLGKKKKKEEYQIEISPSGNSNEEILEKIKKVHQIRKNIPKPVKLKNKENN